MFFSTCIINWRDLRKNWRAVFSGSPCRNAGVVLVRWKGEAKLYSLWKAGNLLALVKCCRNLNILWIATEACYFYLVSLLEGGGGRHQEYSSYLFCLFFDFQPVSLWCAFHYFQRKWLKSTVASRLASYILFILSDLVDAFMVGVCAGLQWHDFNHAVIGRCDDTKRVILCLLVISRSWNLEVGKETY